MKLSPNFVKSMLAGHSQIGLIFGALLYFICLTGTLAVFFEEFERWEQPDIAEYSELSPRAVEHALTQFPAKSNSEPLALYLVLPTKDVPRAHVSDGVQEWFVDEEGNYLQPPVEGWTAMLKSLHAYLHLPQTFGLILVSIAGVMLLKLTISGVLSHPRIIKDAFRFRADKSRHQQQADLHNRLSVWGLPFHLMISLTGAFFGLLSVFMMLVVPIYYDGDAEAMLGDVYGGDPEIHVVPKPVDIQQAALTLKQQAPEATPIYYVVHHMGKPSQYLEIAATLPGRLVYSEMYRFDQSGEYIDHQGLSDGEGGRQVLYSLYRLHFGHFGHFAVKIFYFLLGLALCVICVSGINIWLAKRGLQDPTNRLWSACVWGLPLSLSLAAVGAMMALPPLVCFLVCALICLLGSVYVRNVQDCDYSFKRALSLSLLLVVAVYLFKYYTQLNMLSVGVNLVIFLTGVAMTYLNSKGRRKTIGRDSAQALS